MILQLNELRDKLAGCWTGKNVGGVLGAPFECKRMIPNVDFYVQDLTQGPPANDDLDLQIVWLAAVERYGRNVNASILGEYWLSYVIPNWVEYGTGKANLKAGIVPPMCGDVDNTYKNSNGCWIRSELWACLAPGHPEIATRYAFEDAIVDHADEGMYAEIFTSAIQSAAFVENDREKLEKEIDAVSRIGGKVEFCEATELPFATSGAVRFQGQAQLNPAKLMNGLVKELEKYQNIHVYEGVEIDDWFRRAIWCGMHVTVADHIISTTHTQFYEKLGKYNRKLHS